MEEDSAFMCAYNTHTLLVLTPMPTLPLAHTNYI